MPSALTLNSTWQFVPLKFAQNIAGCKRIFRVILDGTEERCKASLWSTGFTNDPDIDYSDTFCPIIKQATHAPFIYLPLVGGVSNIRIYMRQSRRLIDPTHPTQVCKLTKAIFIACLGPFILGCLSPFLEPIFAVLFIYYITSFLGVQGSNELLLEHLLRLN
ncbi:hypothetical protein BVRB_2g025100 [Beta vulgaris subsp. vulgaris]|nr:hypothetical protein BVRB_2g025100 [Beta vulgaris subsp. vulgaris]